MKINHIRTAYFDVADGGMYISTGLFDSNGKPLSDLYMSNILGTDQDENDQKKKPLKRNILLGLNIRHPLIAYLCTCKDPNRAAYSLTYVVNQLAMCQRSLVPYSGFHQLNKAKLKDIAVLKSMGAGKNLIRKIFTAEGILISLSGSILGLVIGFILLSLQVQFGLVQLGSSEGSFIIEAYPVKMLPLDFLYVFLTVLVIGFLATWYPVRYLTRKYADISLR